MKTLRSGPEGTIEPGQEITLSDEEAKATVEGGYGEYVDEPQPEPVPSPESQEEPQPEPAQAHEPEEVPKTAEKPKKTKTK